MSISCENLQRDKRSHGNLIASCEFSQRILFLLKFFNVKPSEMYTQKKKVAVSATVRPQNGVSTNVLIIILLDVTHFFF